MIYLQKTCMNLKNQITMNCNRITWITLLLLITSCHTVKLTGSSRVKNIDSVGMSDNNPVLPPPTSMPPVPQSLPVASVQMGDTTNLPEVKADFPMSSGPFEPNWTSIN